MNKYEIRIYWSELDNAYVAEAPELPGCMADGNTSLGFAIPIFFSLAVKIEIKQRGFEE
jgi:hypothetical protein